MPSIRSSVATTVPTCAASNASAVRSLRPPSVSATPSDSASNGPSTRSCRRCSRRSAPTALSARPSCTSVAAMPSAYEGVLQEFSNRPASRVAPRARCACGAAIAFTLRDNMTLERRRPVAVRVTTVLRREDGAWKVVDRHADEAGEWEVVHRPDLVGRLCLRDPAVRGQVPLLRVAARTPGPSSSSPSIDLTGYPQRPDRADRLARAHPPSGAASYQSAWNAVPLCSVATVPLAPHATAAARSGQLSAASCQCLAMPAGDS